jgi:hypothetical protein
MLPIVQKVNNNNNKDNKRRPLEEPGVDGRIILQLIFKKCMVGHGLD